MFFKAPNRDLCRYMASDAHRMNDGVVKPFYVTKKKQ